jgi:uncharacterized repeat protein (TIGR02543 family)
MKKTVYGFIIAALAALVVMAGVLACETPTDGGINNNNNNNKGPVTVTFTLDGASYTKSVETGTTIDDAYVATHKNDLGGTTKFGVSGLILNLANGPVKVSGAVEIPLVWKFNGTAVQTWRTVTFTVNDTPYTVSVPDGASLTAGQQAALEAFLHAPSGSLAEVTWSDLSSITEDKTPEAITVTTYTVTFVLGNEEDDIEKEAVANGTVTLPDEPTRDGFVFDDWYTGENGTGTAFTASTPVTADITVYANWMEEEDDFNIIEEEEEGEEEENETGNETPATGLAAIGFALTANNSSGDGFSIFDESSTVEDEGATENWVLNTVEKANVYFAVTKTADQTIAVSGKDAGNVTVTADGSEIDGTTTGNMLAVVTVDAGDFETQFNGGAYAFTLTVSESGETLKTININLNSGIDTGYGVTIFKVTYEGEEGSKREKLEKLNAKIGVQTSYRADTDVNTWQIDPQTVDSLYDANRWLEYNAVSGTAGAPTEYLIRLNEDQETKPINMLVNTTNTYITVRLRGWQVKRTITPPATGFVDAFNTRTNTSGGLISVGNENTAKHLTLTLENITLDGCQGRDGLFFISGSSLNSLLRLNNGVTVIMDNATITNFYGKSGVSGTVPVYAATGTTSQFIMKHNSCITGNRFDTSSDTSKAAMILVRDKKKTQFTFQRDDTSEITGNTPDKLKVYCSAITDGGELYE